MSKTLILVACGRRKVWDRDPAAGPTLARDAYTGGPFRLNRAYAERFGERWLILSARHGLIAPEFVLPGPYDVTFKRPSTSPVAGGVLRGQARALALAPGTCVVVLGGAGYRAAALEAFAGTPACLSFPLAGLPVGKAMQALRRALDTGVPLASV
jgi:hypothetical protein